MRLGQLARQLEINPEKIINFLKKEKDIIIKSHPNAKVEDNFIDEITNHFQQKDNKIISEEKDLSQPKKTESEQISEEEINKEPTKAENDNSISSSQEPEPEAEHIVRPEPKIDGLKVIGKIDLPDKKEIKVEIDGVVYDQEFLDNKKKEELKEKKEQIALEKEQKKKEAAEKRRIELEKRKLEEERLATLDKEENNILSEQEERKKEIIRKAQEERERKLEEKRKKRQAEFYKKKHKKVTSQPKKNKKENEIVEEVETSSTHIEEPKETNLIKRFLKWLNT